MSIRKSVLALALAMPLASAFPAFADTPEDAPVTALDSGLIGIMKAGSASQSFTQRAATLTPIGRAMRLQRHSRHAARR